jgi:hypothetical protein
MDWKNPKKLKFFLWEKSKALNLFFVGVSPELVCQLGDSFLYVLVHHLCGLKLFAVYDFVFYFE